MKKTKRSVQIGLGASSILMIFVVLCMMILSVLSYNRAMQNEAIARRERQYQEDYYQADTRLELVQEALKTYEDRDMELSAILKQEDIQKVLSGLSVTRQGNTLQVIAEVNTQQQLIAEFQWKEGKLTINSWKLSSKGGE